MTRRRRLLASALVSAIVVVASAAGGARVAHACSCVDQPLAQYADDVVAAFVGTQTDRTVDDAFAADGVTLTFEVDRAYVGDIVSPFTVSTHAQSSACGLDVSNLGQVAVVAFGSRRRPSIGLCGSLRSVDELIRAFGPGFEPLVPATRPDDGSGESTGSNAAARLGLLGVLLAIVGAGGMVVVRQRRS